MNKMGYYEIGIGAGRRMGTRAYALAGNVIYNRLHWHEHLEVMCCLKGQFCIRVDGEVYTLGAGDFLTVNSNCVHEIFDGTENGLQIIFSVDTSLLKKSREEQYVFTTVGERALKTDCEDAENFRMFLAQMAYLMTPERAELARIFKTNQKEEIFREEKDWYRYYVCLYRCLECMAGYKKTAAEKKKRRPQEQLQQCIRLIHREYGQKLDAAVLAEMTGLSQPTIYRMFQRQLGISLNDYIRVVRIHAACAMMEKTSADIAQIAFSCGFFSLSNFYRVFRQQMGMTPREYRSQRQYVRGKDPLQEEFLDLNRFQNFYELPYTKEDLRSFCGRWPVSGDQSGKLKFD